MKMCEFLSDVKCSQTHVAIADNTGTTACATRDRDNLDMASLALNKFLILYGANSNLMSKFLQSHWVKHLILF